MCYAFTMGISLMFRGVPVQVRSLWVSRKVGGVPVCAHGLINVQRNTRAGHYACLIFGGVPVCYLQQVMRSVWVSHTNVQRSISVCSLWVPHHKVWRSTSVLSTAAHAFTVGISLMLR